MGIAAGVFPSSLIAHFDLRNANVPSRAGRATNSTKNLGNLEE